MSEYYYFSTTLPTLAGEASSPIRYSDFLASASELLSKADYGIVEEARLYVPQDGSFPLSSGSVPELRDYYHWELSLRNELSKFRAIRLGKAPEGYRRPGDSGWEASRVAQAASALESPLEGEIFIERERWAYLDRLECGHYFDLVHIVIYALKLQSLERRARFELERGEKSYSAAYDSILAGASMPRAEGDLR